MSCRSIVLRKSKRITGIRPLALLLLALGGGFFGCEEEIATSPPKETNLPPETFLQVEGDSLLTQFYKLQLFWLGTDGDGSVDRYRYRWTCHAGDASCALANQDWVETQETEKLFVLPAPEGAARYVFEVAAIDNEGLIDATPRRQEFQIFDNPPVTNFEPGTLPTLTLPAITFFFTAVDPDTTVNDEDKDSRVHLSHYKAWLDGSEDSPLIVPIANDAVTLRLEDFAGRFGPRTLFVQVFDDGEMASDIIQHTWQVDSAPINGVLLVDDCRMRRLAQKSDLSFKTVVETAAPGRVRIFDVEALPRVTRDDLEATLALFDQLIWYTDADTASSGALELATDAIITLLAERQGRVFFSSGLVFGTRSVFGEREIELRDWFGVEDVFLAPDSTTNFSLSRADTIQAAVSSGLSEFTLFNHQGLGNVMDCVKTRVGPKSKSLYFYPPLRLIRPVENRSDFSNPVQFDIGSFHESPNGAKAAFVSFPIGLPINSNRGENEVEILELLKLVGIVDP